MMINVFLFSFCIFAPYNRSFTLKNTYHKIKFVNTYSEWNCSLKNEKHQSFIYEDINWVKNLNNIKQMQDTTPKEPSLAELHLKKFAKNSKRQREIGAVIVGIGGVGFIIFGSTLSDWGGWRKYAMLNGAGIVAGSILLYAIPNPEEKEFNKVSRIEDPVKRRETAHNALYSLANNARKYRIIGSQVLMGFSAWMLFSDTFKDVPHNKIISIGFLSGSLLNLLVLKSPAENTLKSYLEERKQLKENNQSYRIDLHFGINQYGKGNLNLVLSF